MSESIIICLQLSSLPTVEQVRAGALARGLILETWDKLTLTDIEGFWPATYQGEDAGCEFFCGETDFEEIEELEVNRETLEGKDMSIDLGFGGDPRDLLSAAIIVDYLCAECDGSVYSEDDESFLAGESAVYWAKQLLDEANQMIRDE